MSHEGVTLGLVIVSYKYGHLAAHCIESALSQRKRFDEILFIDDGVGDCEHLKTIYQNRPIVFFRNDTNLGTVATFNKMLHTISTDYVMFVGADNWLASDTCESISRVIHKPTLSGHADVVTYDIVVTGELKDEIHRIYSHQMRDKKGDYHWTRANQHHGSMAYRRQLAIDCGGYAHNNTSTRTDEDLNLWNKMMSAGAKMVYLPDAYLFYRRHKENFNKY